jgi:hypothetical protein
MARALRSAALIGLVALALTGCGRSRTASRSGFDPQEAFQAVLELRDAADAARLDLARTARPVESWRLEQSRSSRETAEHAYREALVRFLNAALNESPQAPETRQALVLYAREVESTLEESGRLGGDGQGALEALTATSRACREAGVEEPPALRSALAKARAAAVPTPGRAP